MRLLSLAVLTALVAACSTEVSSEDDGADPSYTSRFDLACGEGASAYGAEASPGFDAAGEVFAHCSGPLPEPCQTLSVRDGSSRGTPGLLDRLTFDCLADAFIASEPALIRMTRGNGINFNTTHSVAIIGDGSAVVRFSDEQDLGGTSTSYAPRAQLRTADHFEDCKAIADDEEAAVCLFDFSRGCAESGDLCSRL